MIVYAYALTRIWLPERLAEQARSHARSVESDEMGDPTESEGSWRQKLTSREGWRAIARAYVHEWKMVWKEILFGFTVAGFISVFVPQSFWNAIFLDSGTGTPSLLTVLENAAVAPVVAFFTFIGSMGNVPLAAMLWSREASFGGVMAFLGADLVAATVVYIHARYYGWRYAAYLSGVLYVAMVGAGLTVHYVFDALGIIPTERPSLRDMVAFRIDYTFWLNLVFIGLGFMLLHLGRKRPHEVR
jgi:uncharacterized membrane protein YraQ (UPF0718 family)